MRIEIKMPKLGYDMEVGKISGWLKSVGDPVERGEPLVEVETEKTTIEIEALRSGVLDEIVFGEDSEVPIGAVIGFLEVPDDH